MFDGLWHRALLYEQAKIDFLEKELEKIDRAEAADAERSWGLKEASFDLESLLNSPYLSASQTPCQTSHHMQAAQLPKKAQASIDAPHFNQPRGQSDKDRILEALLPTLIRYGREDLLASSTNNRTDRSFFYSQRTYASEQNERITQNQPQRA